MEKNILVIEDSRETAENIRLYLHHNKFNCDIAYSGLDGYRLFQNNTYHMIILDVMLPDLDGISVCKMIRESSDVPVLMLTAKVTDLDLVNGLDCGADDYMKKPYSNKELIARIKAHLRRYSPLSSNKNIGPFTLNRSAQTININNECLDLTKTEYRILLCLLNSPQKKLSREQLFLSAFDQTSESYERTVDVHLHNLRKKIAQTGQSKDVIKSVYGIGYQLDFQ